MKELLHKGGLAIVIALLILFQGVASYSSDESAEILFSRKDIKEGIARVKGYKKGMRTPPSGVPSWDNGLFVTLSKGKSVYISKEVESNVSGKVLKFSLYVDGINHRESDYRVKKSKYPFFLLLVFNESPGNISLKKKITRWARSLWNEKVETRKNLMYAFGNRLPSDSVITPEEGAVIVSVGDEKDLSQVVKVSRDIEKDFFIAFGTSPGKQLKKIVIGFEEDNEDKKISVSVSPLSLVPVGKK